VPTINGNTPLVIVVTVLGLYATVLTFQEARLRDLAECWTMTTTDVAVLQTEYENIEDALDEIKVMLRDHADATDN
jgi:hypothetical protein